MHRLETKKQEGIREKIADFQEGKSEEKMKKLEEELQKTLGKPGRREDAKGMLINLGKRLEREGLREDMFAEFLKKEVDYEFGLMFKQVKKEWIKALDDADDLEKVNNAREDIKSKFSMLGSMVETGKRMLAVAYSLNDASREGGVEKAFSKMSGGEAEIFFNRFEKEASEHLDEVTKGEVSDVFRRIAFGV